MERKFLENFKVGDQSLPKEIIDAIMAENGRDIENAKKPFADYETIKEQLGEAQKTIKGFEDQDIEGVRKSAKDWEEKYNQAIEDHKQQMDDLSFNGEVDETIKSLKGKNVKAIKALLDLDTLKASKNRATDIKDALDAVLKDNGYLFGDDTTPAPYAGGTGTGGNGAYNAEDSLRAAMGLSAKK